MKQKLPKISVLMITYNHEKFIAQAIESVLMQKTNFDIELVIGEDCSTDKTREICISYQKKFPSKIKLLLPKKNLGVKENFLMTLKECDGEYIAWLEGDDFWTDSNKLQIQIDFLEKNDDFSICFHDEMIEEFETDKLAQQWKREIKEVSNIEDICKSNFICANTVVFRNLRELANFAPEGNVLDWVLWVYLAQYGKIKYINKTMSTYRVHSGGIFSKKNELEKFIMSANSCESWKKMIGNLCNKEFGEIAFFYYKEIINLLNEDKVSNKDLLYVYTNKLTNLLESNKYAMLEFKRFINLTESLKKEISDKETEVKRLEEEIAFIKNSKFWKIRQFYMKFKKLNENV